MRGADALIETLIRGGVDICFANPGTSEMHLVDAIAARPSMRAILGVHETVCSGAADGYARMQGKPALVLLHLGPGLANALANLHNAGKAHTPVVVVVGDHPQGLRALDPPLASDIEAMAKGAAKWIATARTADELAPLAAQALTAALTPPMGVSVLVVPNDAAWSPTQVVLTPQAAPPPKPVPAARLATVAKALKAGGAAFLLGGGALAPAPLGAAAGIAAATGAKVFSATFAARQARGAGRAEVERLPYFPAMVFQVLAEVKTLILVGARPPISFFAYPNVPYEMVPAGGKLLTLAEEGEDAAAALAALAKMLEAPPAPPRARALPAMPKGGLTTGAAAALIARHLPEDAIISDDATTAGLDCYMASRAAAAHDWLFLTGGAIGQGIPAAAGAALACPQRRVFSLQGDGAGLYCLQGLWTQAREGLGVTTVIFANNKYRILEMEMMMARGGNDGRSGLFELAPPAVDWVKLAQGLGVPARRAASIEELDAALAHAAGESGPFLIAADVT
jgi:acetolactate synthase-1/2/3 large subunit